MTDVTLNPVTPVTNGGIVTMSNPLPVTAVNTPGVAQEVEIVDENGTPLDYTIPAPVQEAAAASATETKVDSLATNQTLLAASSTRLHASIYNSDANALLIKLGATASATSFSYRIPSGSTWDMPLRYVGIIDGIWEADGSGSAFITSLNA